MIGTTVGSYRIISKLSVGGMGTVYRAQHELIGRLAAVKVLHPELCTNQEIVDRFFNEAKATTAIKHPGIVEVFDFGYMESGHAYLIMEFLEGMTLADRCQHRGKMSEGEAAMLLRGVCSALAAAHAKGIVHRDLKPDNIFMVPDADSAIGERAKILDFGIAKLTDIGLGSISATKTGAVMGTPTYMSPEQCKGTGEVDLRADLYSMGCIFYELVTGRPPFTDLGAGELIGAHLYVEPVRPSTIEPELSAQTESLIMALLSKQPAKRPQTAKELAHRLAAIAQQHGWITQTSPSGVTAPSLSELPVIKRNAVRDSAPPVAPTEAALPRSTDNPTTLSGAASQSFIDVPKRSRKRIAIATALVGVGTVTAVLLSRTSSAPVGPMTAGSGATHAPDPSPVLEFPTPTVKAGPVPSARPDVPPATPAPAGPAPIATTVVTAPAPATTASVPAATTGAPPATVTNPAASSATASQAPLPAATSAISKPATRKPTRPSVKTTRPATAAPVKPDTKQPSLIEREL